MTTDLAIVRAALDDVRSRWQARRRLQVAARAGAGVAAIWGAAWIAVVAGRLGGVALGAVAMVALVASVAWLVMVVRRRTAAPNDHALARYIEERCPELDDRLVTAVDVAGRGEEATSPLARALVADAARAVSRAPLSEVVPADTLKTARLRTAGAAMVLLAVLVGWIGPGRRALGVAEAWLLPGRLALEVSPGNVRLAPGEPLVIRARTAARDVVPELTVVVGASKKTIAMTPEGGGYRVRFDNVPGSFGYRVSAAGRRSPDYTVTLLERPRVEAIDLRYEFPAYAKMPPREEQDGGDIYAPSGTTVRLSVKASAGTSSGALVVGDARIPLAAGPDGRFEGSMAVSKDGSYRVALTSGDGIASPGDTEYFIRVLDDRPPEVRIVRPASDRQVTPLEEVTIEARADDDYGIAAFDLVYRVRGGPERTVPFTGEPLSTTATGRHTLYLEELGVTPGDFVTYYARARDIGRGKRSTEARSDIFFLEVKPFTEEFAALQSQAMSGVGNRSLDDLVSAQKDVIVATWKLDRRSGAGRSVGDVKAVARAQGDVRQRAERAVSMLRSPRRRPSAPAGAAADADPMSSAVAAMGRAETALDAIRTSEAIPPEMEALNHLLRAQAENRRREVARQQAGNAGGGGSNRAQQDLSTLFDRELKRQQQTNYETPRSAAQQESEGKSEALEKLRELARRQEQLARQQDDLARTRDELAADEVKRRLERLTREQTELRRQAEQLAQQMNSNDRGQPQRSGSSGLRDASEEMQAAAGDLRREDPRQASARSARAAERLRAIERQLQGQSPDERRRALGDMQLETRQLAGRQRQVSEQAAHTRGQAGPDDERRRLAGEQDRLAGRADRLQQQLQGLGQGGEAASKAAVARAGRELEGQHVGDRMREAARGLRSGTGAAGDEAARRAQAEGTEAARALERLADRLGDAGGARDADGEKLSDQLARAREVRERLDDLQRQIAELRGRQGQQAQPGQAGGRDGRSQDAPGAQREARGQPQGGGRSRAGAGGAGQGAPNAELQRLQREYSEQVREAARLREELSGRQGTTNGGTGAGSTPEGRLMVLSAPGTEAFKQDFSKWEILHKDVTLGLERLEAGLSQKLLERALRDRLSSGGADAAPGEYQDAVDRYFKSLAAPKR